MNIRQLVKNTSLGENSSYRTPQVRHGRGIKEFTPKFVELFQFAALYLGTGFVSRTCG